MIGIYGGGLLRRRFMMEEPLELMTFESATDAVFYNRYSNANQPYYCNIEGNHIDMNTKKQTSSIWFWSGNLSAYNSGNKEWLFVPAGTTVKMEVNFNTTNAYSNMTVNLKDASATSPNSAWLGCSAKNISTTGGISTSSRTATSDVYLYLSFNTTPASYQFSVDVKIYLNGKRVV